MELNFILYFVFATIFQQKGFPTMKQKVILISIDGMRSDGVLPDRYSNLQMEFSKPGSYEWEDYQVAPYDFAFLFDGQNLDGSCLPSFESYKEHAANCIYAQSIAAEGVEGYVEKFGRENADVSFVFITEMHDTRYEQYSVLRPLK